MNRARTFAAVIFFAATAAFASWYDDYDAGLDAVRKGQWQAVIQKMPAAISGNAKENDKARTYGAIFINYHPYYYRGVAHLNLGHYEQAVSDFEKTSGPGPEDLGGIDTLMQKAKAKLAAPVPEPQPQPVRPVPAPLPVPVPVQPAAPTMDQALRQQVTSEINSARGRMTAAQQRKATGAPQFAQATQALADANTRSATAKSNDDLRTALAAAQNAALLFDAAAAPTIVTTTTVPQPSRPTTASTLVLGDTTKRVRSALQQYFNGDFDEAARGFQSLTNDLPNNGWIYAFLGASQYSVYAFETDENYKTLAMDSFKKARRYGKFKAGLPPKYFSRRIRKAFDTVAN